ncbi:MAG: gliding motility-associated C-terminal domain-containing protein [Bacteroidota bacterium]
MQLRILAKIILSAFVLLMLDINQAQAQCSPAIGAPPSKAFFHTGGSNPGEADSKWMIATDSLNGNYKAAIVMTGLSSEYYNPQTWLSFSPTGEHGGSIYLFYKLEFNLACANLCGKSYNDNDAFCLNLDLYADNSVFEIFVNGVPQSGNLPNVPVPNPFNPNLTPKDKTTVALCQGWKAGANSLVIQLASSATVAGLLVEASTEDVAAPNADTVAVSICEGEGYNFGNKVLTAAGYYFQTFTNPNGCDSSVVLNLSVQPVKGSTIDTAICAGQSFLGYNQTGNYVTRYPGTNGCDSIRTVNLVVQEKPAPTLQPKYVLCAGDSLALNPGDFLSYTWQDGSANENFVVSKPGSYSVTVTNTCGSTLQQVLVEEGMCTVYFPSAFTPNGDGKNDRFKVLTSGALLDFELTVFNRWGQVVYKSNDPAAGWNGTIQGVKQPPGGFTWICRFTTTKGAAERRGKLVLLR